MRSIHLFQKLKQADWPHKRSTRCYCIFKQGVRRCWASACLAVIYLLRRSPEDKLAVWFPISRLSGPKFPCMEEGVERFGDLIRGTWEHPPRHRAQDRFLKCGYWPEETENWSVRVAARILWYWTKSEIMPTVFFNYKILFVLSLQATVWCTFCDFPRGCLSYTRFLAHILKHSSLQSGPGFGLFFTARMCDYRLPALLKKLGFGCFPHKTGIVGSEKLNLIVFMCPDGANKVRNCSRCQVNCFKPACWQKQKLQWSSIPPNPKHFLCSLSVDSQTLLVHKLKCCTSLWVLT